MQIHRIRGRDLRDALLRARRTHGEDALVIGHEASPGGVTLAVARRPQPVVRAPRAELSPFEREVGARLRRHGASPSLIERVAAAVEARIAGSGGSDRHVIDVAAEAIGELFEVARAPRARGAMRCLAFAGAAGVGKTAGLTKLAAELVRSGRRIGIATLDTRRMGAVEGLRASARRLGVPYFPLHGAPDFAREDLRTSGLEALLVDTTGRPAFDAEGLGRLARSLGRASAPPDAYLVLPATASRAALADAQRAFASLAPAGCVVSKLDETHEPAPVLEHALLSGLPIAFLADGPEVDASFHRARADRFADLLLRGRIA